MQVLVYDGTFEGWLTTVFHVYEYKFTDVDIKINEQVQPGFFGAVQFITTNSIKYNRVLQGLRNKISAGAIRQLYACFLSELPNVENLLLRYVQYIFSSKISVENDYSNQAVIELKDIAKKVHREKHRMEAFIRFQLTQEGIYYAICQPDFNVLPLIEKHFTERYTNQKWLIYDGTRKYGLYYDLFKVEPVELNFNDDCKAGANIAAVYAEDEVLYQELWKHYFNNVNIKARKNTKLHIQHMPKRYWKFLPEKSVEKK